MKKPRKIARWKSGHSVAYLYASLESGKPVVSIHGGSLQEAKRIQQWLDKAIKYMESQEK